MGYGVSQHGAGANTLWQVASTSTGTYANFAGGSTVNTSYANYTTHSLLLLTDQTIWYDAGDANVDVYLYTYGWKY